MRHRVSFEFHTPELPVPLGLDLARLELDCHGPSQFLGTAHDGCEVYVRYRGGALSIRKAHEPGLFAVSDGEVRGGPGFLTSLAAG